MQRPGVNGPDSKDHHNQCGAPIKVKFLTLKLNDTLQKRGLKQINQYEPLVSEGPSMTKSEIMDTVTKKMFLGSFFVWIKSLF